MSPKPKAEEKPVAQTVKLEQRLFERLKVFSAKTRRTHQDILRTALLEYLKQMNTASGL
jgi:predicted DNA-binding protein